MHHTLVWCSLLCLYRNERQSQIICQDKASTKNIVIWEFSIIIYLCNTEAVNIKLITFITVAGPADGQCINSSHRDAKPPSTIFNIN